jgi:hypothetical protein
LGKYWQKHHHLRKIAILKYITSPYHAIITIEIATKALHPTNSPKINNSLVLIFLPNWIF